MSAVENKSVAKATTPIKAVKVAKSKSATIASTGPTFKSQMMLEAIKHLNDRSGSSRQACVKYIAAKFNLDTELVNKRIKKFIAIGLKDGSLKQIKGTGSNGSFKLGEAALTKEKEDIKKAKLDAKKAAKGDVAKPKKVVKKVAKSVDTSKPKKNITKIIKSKIPKTVSPIKPSKPVVSKSPVPVVAQKTLLKVKPVVKKVAATKVAAKAKSPAAKPVVAAKAKPSSVKKAVVAKQTIVKTVAKEDSKKTTKKVVKK
jgi:hypothetical protein